MDVRLDGSVIDTSEVHPRKVCGPLDVRLDGSVIDTSEVHLLKV